MLNVNELRDLRKRQGWTQKQLAKMLGLHSVTICRYEKGKKPVPKQTLLALEKIFENGAK